MKRKPRPWSWVGTILVLFIPYFAYSLCVGTAPWWTFYVYGGLSLLSCLLYSIDKIAAQAPRTGVQPRRFREDNLHLLALLGGWPGAYLAQQLIRHKSSKVEFQRVFILTVLVNVVVFVVLTQPGLLSMISSLMQS